MPMHFFYNALYLIFCFHYKNHPCLSIIVHPSYISIYRRVNPLLNSVNQNQGNYFELIDSEEYALDCDGNKVNTHNMIVISSITKEPTITTSCIEIN